MEKVFLLMAIVSLSFTSCSSSNEENHQEPEQARVETQEVKKEVKKEIIKNQSGIVHRVEKDFFKSRALTTVRLKNGKILSGTVETATFGYDKDQIENFFFSQPGDTIFYDGDDVIEVRFKD